MSVLTHSRIVLHLHIFRVIQGLGFDCITYCENLVKIAES